MTKPLKSNATSTYVQLEPGTEPHYIGDCVAIDSIPNPRGGVSLIQCIDPWGNYKTMGDKQDAPGTIDFTLENLLFRAASWLEDLDCSFSVYALQGCGKRGVFGDWLRGVAVQNCRITDDPMSNVAQRTGQDEILHSHEVSGWTPRHDYRQMTVTRIPNASAQAFNTIDGCSIIRCDDDCGDRTPLGEVMVAGAQASGAATADVFRSVNSGETWAATATDPFTVNTESVVSIRCFMIDNTTTRILALRSTNAGAPLQCSYSDDGGTTWTRVTIGVTNAEAGVRDQSLMVLGYDNIWACTSLGRVYKSTDGGVSWTNLTTALAASGASALNAVHFYNEKVGYAAGAGGVTIKTLDGGINWAATTVVPAAVNTLWTFSAYRVLAGTSTGRVYQTWDGGVTWTAMNNFNGAGVGAVNNIKMLNAMDGFMIHQTAAPIGYLFRTIDGGYSWVRHDNPSTFAGLNAVYPTRINACHGVGAVQGGTAVIFRGNG